MPALQQIYNNAIRIKFTIPALDSVYNDLKGLKPYNPSLRKDALKLNKKITLKNLYYNYPNSARTALKNINFKIEAFTTVGLVGSAGMRKNYNN